MKPFYLSLLILLCGCSSVREVIHPGSMRITDEVSGLIENIIHVGQYTPGMNSGETFVYLLPQGIPFSIQDIIPLQQSGGAVFGDLHTIDKLYIASQITDRIFICDSIVHLSDRKLADMDIEEKDLYKLMSPTFNESFLYSTIYPLISDSNLVWSSFNHQSYQEVIIKRRKHSIHIALPHIRATGEFATLLVCRPWLHATNITEYFPDKKVAIIEGVILSKNFNIKVMHGKCSIKIYRHREKKYKITNNPVSIDINYPNCIIGYYCRIL